MDGYKKVKVVGKGAFGAAILVQAKDVGAQQYVIKMLDFSGMKADVKASAKKEVRLLSAFDHPNIIKYRESFVHSGKLCIVMEFAEGGDLHALIKEQKKQSLPLPESSVLDYFVQLCLAMEHVHEKKVLHRDLKPQNIFLSHGRRVLKLGDFGVARTLENSFALAKTKAGTPYYMSPEICNGTPYNDRSDVWSMGCVLYELAALRPPFEARDLMGLIKQILRGTYQPPPPAFSNELALVVSSCLSQEPSKRPSVRELLANNAILASRAEGYAHDARMRRQGYFKPAAASAAAPAEARGTKAICSTPPQRHRAAGNLMAAPCAPLTGVGARHEDGPERAERAHARRVEHEQRERQAKEEARRLVHDETSPRQKVQSVRVGEAAAEAAEVAAAPSVRDETAQRRATRLAAREAKEAELRDSYGSPADLRSAAPRPPTTSAGVRIPRNLGPGNAAPMADPLAVADATKVWPVGDAAAAAPARADAQPAMRVPRSRPPPAKINRRAAAAAGRPPPRPPLELPPMTPEALQRLQRQRDAQTRLGWVK